MNDWKNADHRRAATRTFCEWLHDPANIQDRLDCTIKLSNETDPTAAYKKARELFADKGGFVREESYAPGTAPKEAIPAAVQFRVYEETELIPRDNLVTLVLPRPDQPLPTGTSFKVMKYYRCTWTPWRSRLMKPITPKLASRKKTGASH